MQRHIPEKRPTLLWERTFDFVLDEHPPAIGDGKVLFAALSPSPTPLIVVDLENGSDGTSVVPPEEIWAAGAPSITPEGELVMPFAGLERDGLYVVRGNSTRAPWIDVLDAPQSRPSEPSGTALWALATSAGFVHVPRSSVIEWRFDEPPDRIRSFEELPIAASSDVVVTCGVDVLPEISLRSPRDVWLYGPAFTITGGTFLRGLLPERIGRRSSGVESHRFIFRNRRDGTRIGESRAPHLVSIDHRRCVTREENRLRSENVEFPESGAGQMELDAPLVAATQAPGVLVVAIRRPNEPIRLQRFRDDGVTIGTSLVYAQEIAIVALDHTRILYLADSELIAEPLTEPGTTLWRLRLPPSDGGETLFDARDGFIVAHDRHRGWCWSDRG